METLECSRDKHKIGVERKKEDRFVPLFYKTILLKGSLKIGRLIPLTLHKGRDFEHIQLLVQSKGSQSVKCHKETLHIHLN